MLISSARLRHGVIVDGRGCRPSSSPGSVKNSRDLSRVTTRSSQHTAGRVLIAGRRQRVARSRFDRFHRLSRTYRARARASAYTCSICRTGGIGEIPSRATFAASGRREKERQRDAGVGTTSIGAPRTGWLATRSLRAFPFSTTIPAS